MLPKWLLICATKPEWSGLKKHLYFEKDHTFHGLNFFRAETDGTAPLAPQVPQGGTASPPRALRSAKKEILLGQIGVGYEIAERKAHTIFHLFAHPHTKSFGEGVNRPQMVIHFGLSGALRENLKEGDLILPTGIVNADKQPVVLSPDLIQKGKILLKSLNLSAIGGNLFTSAKVLSSPTLKKKAGEDFGAIAVDMETWPFARECQNAGIPFLSIRAIWDTLDWDLSEKPECGLLDEEGNLRTARVLGCALAHPRLLFSLPKYQAAMTKGNRAITRFLMEAIKKWE